MHGRHPAATHPINSVPLDIEIVKKQPQPNIDQRHTLRNHVEPRLQIPFVPQLAEPAALLLLCRQDGCLVLQSSKGCRQLQQLLFRGWAPTSSESGCPALDGRAAAAEAEELAAFMLVIVAAVLLRLLLLLLLRLLLGVA